MAALLFANRLKDLDRRMRSLKRKAIIFTDQLVLQIIIFRILKGFFSANCICELQPIDMGIIRLFNVQYQNHKENSIKYGRKLAENSCKIRNIPEAPELRATVIEHSC